MILRCCFMRTKSMVVNLDGCSTQKTGSNRRSHCSFSTPICKIAKINVGRTIENFFTRIFGRKRTPGKRPREKWQKRASMRKEKRFVFAYYVFLTFFKKKNLQITSLIHEIRKLSLIANLTKYSIK